jgi:hypothetical protein
VAKGAEADDAAQRLMYPSDYLEICRIIGQDCICLECMWTPIRQRCEDGSVRSLFDRSLKSRNDLARVVWPGEQDPGFREGLRQRSTDYYQELFRRALAAGIPLKFHSDGRLDEAMEMLTEMGFSGINPLDPSGIDCRDYKRRCGRQVTLSGGIELTFPLIQGTPQDVEDSIEKL